MRRNTSRCVNCLEHKQTIKALKRIISRQEKETAKLLKEIKSVQKAFDSCIEFINNSIWDMDIKTLTRQFTKRRRLK